MIYNIVEVESIKLGVGNIESLGLSSKEVLKKSISWLRERYEVTEDIRYLQKAVWHIYAYLELGYPYESGETEFNIILKYLKMDIEEVFPKKKMALYQGTTNESENKPIIGQMESGTAFHEGWRCGGRHYGQGIKWRRGRVYISLWKGHKAGCGSYIVGKNV